MHTVPIQRSLLKTLAGWASLATVLLCCVTATAQQETTKAGQLDVAVLYDADRVNRFPGTEFWLQGGSLELVGHAPYGFAVVANVTGLHAGPGSTGVPLSLVTDTFGPRYTWYVPSGSKGSLRKLSHVSLFGQALIGEAHGLGSTFPGAGGVSSSALSFALRVGGGIEAGLSRHISVRALQVDWLRTQLPNATDNVQNNLQIAAGIVFHTSSK